MKRTTPQKQKVLNYIKNTKKHPTAERVYREVKKDLPKISKSTVYRILEEFAKEGKLKKLNLEVTHFDPTTQNHAHFVCKDCGKTRDIKNAKIPASPETELGEIQRGELFYYGICKGCQ